MTISRQEQALKLFLEIVQSILDNKGSLSDNLRKLMRACSLLGWDEYVKYIRSELSGFGQEQELPWYRQRQHWVKEWHSGDAGVPTLTVLLIEGRTPQSKGLLSNIINGVTELELSQERGLRYTTEESQKVTSAKKSIVFTASLHLPPATVALMLERIKQWCFEFASSASITLEFGNLVDDAFQVYRTAVENHLAKIGLSEGLQSIVENLRSKEPMMWRASVLACRSVLQDIASHLWQDTRSVYDQLPGQGQNGMINPAKYKR